jgi:hypothetical protein
MAWGTVTIGGVELRETVTAEQAGAQLNIRGQESHPPSTRAHVTAVHHNMRALAGLTVPVTFTDKPELSGFYRVQAADSNLAVVQNGAHMTAAWSASLDLVGGDRDVEIESRVPTIARSTTVATPPSAVFWHAPAGGATSYWTGATVPTQVTRTSADGPIVVHTGIPASVAPRWTVPIGSYLQGAARVLFDGIRRLGTFTPPLAVWEVDNGLVRLTSGPSGHISVSCWDAGAWRSSNDWRFFVNGAQVTTTPEVTVLRNDPEEVVVRLSYPTVPGRVTVDLGLRRGARFVTGVFKRHSAAVLGVARSSGEASDALTGGLRRTAADADGNRFVLGSATSSTISTTSASITGPSSTAFDFFLGHEVDEAPQAGDAFADLWAQYRGSSGERASVVLR